LKLTGRERVYYWLWMFGFAVGSIALGAWFTYSLFAYREPF